MRYRDAGVDTAKYDTALDRVIQMMRRTYNSQVIENPWGYAGLYSLAPDGQLFQKTYKKPVLVSCADGVGTKLLVAKLLDKHDTVGIDLVAMNVNDLIVCGAEPLFFLDCFSTGKLDERVLVEVAKGIIEGCLQAGCVLLGGETAEMPGMHHPGQYDLLGFAVGIVERSRMIRGDTIRPGDAVVGIASSGLHSNGYSLARKVLLDEARLPLEEVPEGMEVSLGEELLRPTRIYARPIARVLSAYRVKKAIKGLAHITGGGLLENPPRVLPKDCAMELDPERWGTPAIFSVIEKSGRVPREEMYRVFNMGIGMVLIADRFYARAIAERLEEAGEKATVIGQIVRGQQEVRIKGLR